MRAVAQKVRERWGKEEGTQQKSICGRLRKFSAVSTRSINRGGSLAKTNVRDRMVIMSMLMLMLILTLDGLSNMLVGESTVLYCT